MNYLPLWKRIEVAKLLVEGMSLRAIGRAASVDRGTIQRFALRLGDWCQAVHDAAIREIAAYNIECDEMWGFIAKKEKNVNPLLDPGEWGDAYTWVAIEPTSKLVISYLVGKRTLQDGLIFMRDLRSRVNVTPQIATDGFPAYIDAIAETFGADVHYGQIIKQFGTYEREDLDQHKYSMRGVTGIEKAPIFGRPIKETLSTSHVERQNLTMRMSMRRLTRLTNGYSKKLEGLKAAVALHFTYYNFIRLHDALKNQTPAMAIGLADAPWSFEDIVKLTMPANVAA